MMEAQNVSATPISATPAIPISQQQVKTVSVFIPTTATSRVGFVKVRLSYLTSEPRHIQSYILRDMFGQAAPFLESVCVLLPWGKCFDILDVYVPAFLELTKSRILPASARLQGFEILEEDELTQAYLFLK